MLSGGLRITTKLRSSLPTTKRTQWHVAAASASFWPIVPCVCGTAVQPSPSPPHDALTGRLAKCHRLDQNSYISTPIVIFNFYVKTFFFFLTKAVFWKKFSFGSAWIHFQTFPIEIFISFSGSIITPLSQCLSPKCFNLQLYNWTNICRVFPSRVCGRMNFSCSIFTAHL